MKSKTKSALSSCCSVCSAPSASHLHYGAVTCYSCRAFFRRGIGKPYCCVEGTGDCSIDWTSRRSCQWCRFDKCLKVGMNPELVDASLRLKDIKKNKIKNIEPDLINNLDAIENIGMVSDMLRDISSGSPEDIFLPVPSYTTCVGDFGDKKVFLLQDGILSEQDFLYENFNMSPPNSLYSQTESSPTSSLYSSDYSDQMLHLVTNTGDVHTEFDIYMDDTRNIPESIYPLEVQAKEPVLSNNQTSVIVRNISGDSSSITQCNAESSTKILDLHGNEFRYETVTNAEIISDGDSINMAKDSDDDDDDEDEVKIKDFDIETLVEECFMQIQERR